MSNPATAQTETPATIQWPVPPGAARYSHVLVAIEGLYHFSGPSHPGGYPWTKARMQAVAASYDAVNVYAAPINTDHWRFGGPAQGVITAVYYEEGEDGLGRLYVDLAITCPQLEYELSLGMWTARSLEWHDAEALSLWLSEPLEDCLFYDEHELYLTGLGFLGQLEPGVPGLGPLPPRADAGEAEPPIVLIPTRVAAAQAERRPRLRSVIPDPKEGQPMAGEKQTATTGKSPPKDDEAALKARLAELEAEAAESSRRAEQAEARVQELSAEQAGEDPAITAQLQQLKTREESIAQTEARLLARVRDADVEDRLKAHLSDGRLTTQAQRQAYSQLARQLHGRESEAVMLAGGQSETPELGGLDLLDQIIAGFPAQAPQGLLAGDKPGQTDTDREGRDTERISAVKRAAKQHGVELDTDGKGGEQ